MPFAHRWRTVRAWAGLVAVFAAVSAGSSAFSNAQSAAQPASAKPAASSPSCDIQTTERIVAVGDIHGAYDKFVSILREAKLIDSRKRWIGGRAILVQTGDVTDRGPDSREVLDLLRKLTDEAARAGGRVHSLVGNHEAMWALGIFRDASPEEFKAFTTHESQDLRNRYFELLAAENVKRAKAAGTQFDQNAFRKEFMDATPLGAIEMTLAFGAKGEYGRYLRERDAMVKINGIVFVHGGPSPSVAPLGCSAINAQVRTELATLTPAGPDLDKSFILGPDGPLWYRGLVDGTATIGQPEVEAILAALGAKAIVIGHTVADGFRIKPSFGGRVVQIDTGMLNAEFFPGGVPSALEIHGDKWTAIYEGRREPLAGLQPGTAVRDR